MDEILVFVTVASDDEATTIARMLVKQGLAACVNIIPGVRSVFQWEGKVEEKREILLMAKTVKQSFDRLAVAVKAHHSYSVPEIIAVPIQYGSPEYLQWVRDMTKGMSDSA